MDNFYFEFWATGSQTPVCSLTYACGKIFGIGLVLIWALPFIRKFRKS